MTFEVTAGTWPVRGRVFTRGERIDRGPLAELIGERRIPGAVRLGWIREVPAGLDSLLKKELVELAAERGIDLPDRVTKNDIIALLEEQ